VLRRGADEWERELRSAGGFQASAPLEAHFGFTSGDTPLSLEVTWPGGGVTLLEDVAANRVLAVSPPSEEAHT
jgi:hypothetical protein